MFKKQLTIAFTVSLAAYLGTTSAVQLRQLPDAPALAAPVEAVPLVEALPTQEVAALAAPAIIEPAPYE
jgi:hypothetical protein